MSGQDMTFDVRGQVASGYLAIPSQTNAPGVMVLHAWWDSIPFLRVCVIGSQPKVLWHLHRIYTMAKLLERSMKPKTSCRHQRMDESRQWQLSRSPTWQTGRRSEKSRLR